MDKWVDSAALGAILLATMSCSTQNAPPQPTVSSVEAEAQVPSADLQARFIKARDAYSAKDFATAAPLLIQLCEDDNYAQSCAFAGQLVANGQGAERDLAKSLALFEIGCAGGSANSCGSAAAVYEQSAKPIRDDAKAANYEVKACDLGDKQSCEDVGQRYVTGIGVERDADMAYSYSMRACTGMIGAGCTSVGNLYLPYPRTQEKGPGYDRVKAIDYYRLGCELKDGRGCALLADKYEFGFGVEQSDEKALELYRLALSYNPEQWVKNSAKGRIDVLTAPGRKPPSDK